MTSICQAIKKFELTCAEALEDGMEIAASSNFVYGSNVENTYDETYFTKGLIRALRSLRKNNIQVLTSPEQDLGGDLEVHVMHPYGAWTGIRLQAKRARIVNGVYTFPELAHSPKSSQEDRPVRGVQNARLFQRATDSGMLPLYVYYLPTSLVSIAEGRSGAMVGAAWDANYFIENRIKSAATILNKNTMPLSHLLCPLDQSARHFAQRVEQLFIDHVEPIEADADLSEDIERQFPGFMDLEDPVFEETLHIRGQNKSSSKSCAKIERIVNIMPLAGPDREAGNWTKRRRPRRKSPTFHHSNSSRTVCRSYATRQPRFHR